MIAFLKFKLIKKNLFFSIILFFLLLLSFEMTLSLGGYFYFNIYSSLDNPKVEEDAFRILFLGESTTQGHTLGMKNAYPAQVEKILQEKYPDKKIKSYNKGINAIEITAILRNLDRNMIEYKPDLVILMAGCNDNFVLDNKTSDLKRLYSKFKLYRLIVSIKDIFKLTSDIRKDDADFRYINAPYHYKPVNLLSEGIFKFDTIIQTVHSYGSEVWFAGYLQPDAGKNVNPVLKKIAEENDITYVGDYPEVDFEVNLSLFMDDGWHPNVGGHRIIAEKIAEKIIREGVIDRWQPN